MKFTVRPLEWVVWGGLALVIASISGAFFWTKLATGAASSGGPMPVIGQLSDFVLTNQSGQAVSLADLRGQVWVADIIFTRCPGPCLKMTRHFAELQSSLPANEPIKLVSLTSDPEYDSPRILKKYAERFSADSNRWWFLTGDKPQIRRLAVNDFKFVVVEKKPEERDIPEDLFLHSTGFVVVDRQGRVRGWADKQGGVHAYYDSENPDERALIPSAVKQLLGEK
ncbi:MAG: SCO family protein [Verrucomicrobia bacterium]|nr:SCO family protein [Verrucomicrobiota bacterium]